MYLREFIMSFHISQSQIRCFDYIVCVDIIYPPILSVGDGRNQPKSCYNIIAFDKYYYDKH